MSWADGSRREEMNPLRRFFARKPQDAKLAREEEERERIYASFRGITRQLLPQQSFVPVDPEGRFGDTKRVTISRDPQTIESWYRKSEICPICGQATVAGSRTAASLEPEFASGLSFLIGVWVHPECLAKCPQTTEQRGIPW
jgi:hypothetical protein